MKLAIISVLLASLGIMACQQESTGPGSVTIQGTITHPTAQTVTVTARTHIGESEHLGEARLDSSGYFSMTFDIEGPTDAHLTHGSESTQMFLHGGDDITVTFNTAQFDESIAYTGEGADVNNYLAQKLLKEEAYMQGLSQSNMYKMELDTFLHASKKLDEFLTTHYETTFADTRVPEAFETYEATALKMQSINRREYYPVYHGYYTGNEDYTVDESYYTFRDEIDFNDKQALDVPEYREYFDGYVERKLMDLVEEDPELENDWPRVYQELITWIRNNDELKGALKDYVLASQINAYMGYFGTDGLDDHLNWYREHSQNPEYLSVVEDTYTEWSQIARGKPAPDFEYTSIDGDQVALSDFEGKVVYIDIWATWCGPCKREIPHSKTLKQKYADNDKVVFMYVSIDTNKDAWRNYLTRDPEFKGVHLITPAGWKSGLTSDYLINGIPRYILVDQESRIVSASAPRPSSGKVEVMIDELLEGV